jgi:glycerophosphoryl diester phosphodiesterase
MNDPSAPLLVAHRGHASRCPENSIEALGSALRNGVAGVEFDVQLTADGTPVVVHDPRLSRTAGVDRDVREMTFAETRAVSVAEVERLGPGRGHVALPSLEEVVTLLEPWVEVLPFVEIKPESAAHGREDRVTEVVLEVIAPVLERAVVISFSERVVLAARRLGAAAVGWCTDYVDDDARRLADAMEPDFLLADHRRLGASRTAPLWSGPWRWVIYEVVDPELALELAARGAHFVETMACAEMYAHPALAARRLPLPADRA